MSQSNDQLLRQAIELAQANKRAEARQIILKVVAADEENARAWMLLSRITNDPDERRTALINVTNLEPFNTKAREALAELEGKLAISRAMGDDPQKEMQQRRVRRKFLFVLLGLMMLTIIGIVVFVLVQNSQTQNKVQEIEQFNTQQAATVVAETLIAEITGTAVQQVAVELTETYVAMPTGTATPRPTLPPENTLVPTVTPTATLTPIPAPEGLVGQIIGWGGRSAVAGEQDFPIIFISVNDGTITQVSGTNRGQNVTAISTARIVYQRYFRDVFRSELSRLDAITGISEVMSVEWEGSTMAIGETAWPQFTSDGRYLVFIATSAAENTRDVYLLDTTATGEKLRRLTNDGNDYNMPTISPDGSRIIAVRRAKSPNPANNDLVMIDTATQVIEPWTGDGDTTIESMPRWSPDGKLVAYVVVNATTGNGDIYLRTVEGMANVLPVTRTADIDEVHPVFSPDARYMAYSSNFTEGYNIFIYDLLTGAFFQLTFDDERFYPGVWLP